MTIQNFKDFTNFLRTSKIFILKIVRSSSLLLATCSSSKIYSPNILFNKASFLIIVEILYKLLYSIKHWWRFCLPFNVLCNLHNNVYGFLTNICYAISFLLVVMLVCTSLVLPYYARIRNNVSRISKEEHRFTINHISWYIGFTKLAHSNSNINVSVILHSSFWSGQMQCIGVSSS